MMPVYLLSFTILITSVIKMADLFSKTDQALLKRQQQFRQHTRDLHNQQGNISLMAALLTLMISALLMFFALKMKVELKEARYRKDSYLCFQYLNVETKNYILEMARFNQVLRALFLAISSGAGSAQAKILFEATALTRHGRHFYYVKKLAKNKYCSGKTDSRAFFKNLPFIVTPALILETNIDQTTKLRDSQWTNIFYKNPSGIRLKNSFCLKAEYQVEGNLFPNPKIKTSEIAMQGFSKLKCWSGSP